MFEQLDVCKYKLACLLVVFINFTSVLTQGSFELGHS